jgi:hypothetical protein
VQRGQLVGEPLLHHLEARERLPELAPARRERDRRCQRGAMDADRAGRDRQTPRGETAHRDAKSLADLAEHLVARDRKPIERHHGVVAAAVPELDAGHRLAVESRALAVDEEGRDAAASQRRIDRGEQDHHVGDAAVRDPPLLAGRAIAAVALAHGRRAQRRDVAACFGLGQREAADRGTGNQRGQPARELGLRAVFAEALRDEARLHGAESPRVAAVGADLLVSECQLQRCPRAAAVLARQRAAENAGCGQVSDHAAAELARFVDRARVRQQLLFGERADRRCELAVRGVEIAVGEPEGGVHGWVHRPRKRGSRFSIHAL